MEFLERLVRLRRLHNKVRKNRTGPIEAIAREMKTSVADARFMVQLLGAMNDPLEYDGDLQSFTYSGGFPKQVRITVAIKERGKKTHDSDKDQKLSLLFD